MTDTANPMLTTPVNRMLMRMSAPISLGMVSTFLFQIVDTFFVGQLGSTELAALAFTAPVYLLFLSIFMGFSVGVSAVAARAMGAGQPERARGLTMLSLALVLILSTALSYGADGQTEVIFRGLGAAEEILPLIDAYMRILYLSFPLLMLAIIGSGAARAIGITGQTELVFGIAGVVNLVFDYLLIFGIGPFPELGFAGAAWATALSFLTTFVGVTVILVRNGMLGLRGIGSALSGLPEILRFSVPTISMQVLVPATGMFVTYLLAGYGSEAVAAFGVASRIESLALVGIFAVSMSVTPFVAQNFGAGEHDRIDEAVVFAGKASVYIGILLFALLALAGPFIARVFSDDPEVIRFVGFYFRIVAISYGFVGIVNVTASVFNGLHMPGEALKLMLIRTLLIVFPLLLLASFLGLWWILAALTLGNVLSAIVAGRLMNASMRKWGRPIADANLASEYLNDVRRVFTRG